MFVFCIIKLIWTDQYNKTQNDLVGFIACQVSWVI